MTTENENAADEAEWESISGWLLRRDPAKAAPDGFAGRRRRRLVWLMAHPLCAFAVRHHRATALAGAAALLAALLAALFALKARDEELLPPVSVVFAPSGQVPELEADIEKAELPGEAPETPEQLLQ